MERAYDTNQRERLAVAWAGLLLCAYLEGTRFAFRTDHDSRKWTLLLLDATSNLARSLLKLSKLDLDVLHCAGIKHQTADAFLRLPTTVEDHTPI